MWYWPKVPHQWMLPLIPQIPLNVKFEDMPHSCSFYQFFTHDCGEIASIVATSGGWVTDSKWTIKMFLSCPTEPIRKEDNRETRIVWAFLVRNIIHAKTVQSDLGQRPLKGTQSQDSEWNSRVNELATWYRSQTSLVVRTAVIRTYWSYTRGQQGFDLHQRNWLVSQEEQCLRYHI